MARIRTIKPEFPQSESMGRVSREARLLFILLWTLCDDAGRSRGDARLLKGLLYPYDEVTFKQIEAWLAELEREGCLVRYSSEGSRYLAIRNWLTHQKIDKPSKSKFPEPPETVENPREDSRDTREVSSEDQGPRTKDQGRDQGPTREEILARGVEGLDLAAWDRWIEYRIAIRKPLKTPSLVAAAKAMARLGPSQASAVEHSIANQYQGLVEPKTGPGSVTQLTKYERNRIGLYDDDKPPANPFLLTRSTA